MVVRLLVDDHRIVEVAAVHDAMAYIENVGRVDVRTILQMVEEAGKSSCMIAYAERVSPVGVGATWRRVIGE